VRSCPRNMIRSRCTAPISAWSPSVAQPTYEMGKTAGELLTTRLVAAGRPAGTVVLRTTLNVRASSTPMAAALRGTRQA
jgi:DNA-binding LacI/PurR family transcriptional regulator